MISTSDYSDRRELTSVHDGNCADKLTKFRLYVAQSTPSSVRATNNLRLLLEELGLAWTDDSVEIVDIFQFPKRALAEGIVATPTLLILNQTKIFVVIGDLTNIGSLNKYIV